MLDLIFAAAPILFLVYVMTKPRPLPSTVAFFLGAALAYGIRLFYFDSAFMLSNAAVIAGLLDALTPISIVLGAILFFVAMERSGAMAILQRWLRGISPNPVAQVMLVGWSFSFLIEGSSGFGTPAALAAPVLVGLGFPALRVALVCLIMNTVATPFGAVGTPVWFGFDLLGLSEPELLGVGVKIAQLQLVAALVVPVFALHFLIDWRTIRRNLVFIYLSILGSMLPMVAVAYISYEFPSVVGGLCGLVTTILLARFGIGLEREASGARGSLFRRGVLLAMMPLGVTVLILLVTRIPGLGLRGLLTARSPDVSMSMGALGDFAVSASLVVSLEDILRQGLNWSHAVLYVPSIIPFFVTAALALVLYRRGWSVSREVVGETARRVTKPVLALLGALAFVKLLMIDGDRSSTMILGSSLANAAGGAWIYFAPFLGALGSFFSGSTTVSNLAFGGIQESIALDTGMDSATLLALQCSGAAMGNMICIHNIVAVCAVLGLVNKEGEILRKAVVPVVIYGAVLALMSLVRF